MIIPYPEGLTLSPRVMKDIQEIGSASPRIKEIQPEGSTVKGSLMDLRRCLVL